MHFSLGKGMLHRIVQSFPKREIRSGQVGMSEVPCGIVEGLAKGGESKANAVNASAMKHDIASLKTEVASIHVKLDKILELWRH